MAMQREICYINASVCGSSAYQLETKPVRKKRVSLPKPKRAKKQVVAIDPIALVGIGVALVLMVLLTVGFARLQSANADAVAMNRYVDTLQEDNQELKDTYTSGYDLDEVEKIALAMGKVPAAQVKPITMQVHVPVAETEPTAWEAFCAFLTGLFA